MVPRARLLPLLAALFVAGCGREAPPAPDAATESAAAAGSTATEAAAGAATRAADERAPATAGTAGAGAGEIADGAAIEPTPGLRSLALSIKPWKGDFGQMVEAHRIRVLIPYSRTLFFNDKGTARGIAAENARDFEQYINRKYRPDKRPITVLLIPTARDELLADVAAGYGDIAIGNITATAPFSSASKISAGRFCVVPCTRSPATHRHHVSARSRASARSRNDSPAKNESRT